MLCPEQPYAQEEKSKIFLVAAILLRVLIQGTELSHRTVIYQAVSTKLRNILGKVQLE